MIRLISMFLALIFIGCGTFSLQSNAKMTQSIFLKDLQPTKSIYLVLTNTIESETKIAILAKSILEEKGYTFVDKPSNAKYILRINVLNRNGTREQNEANAAATLGITTAIVAGASTSSGKNGLIGGLIGGAVGGIFAYATADGSIRMQTDVVITENNDEGSIEHKTRIFAEATQVHLTPEKGQPILEEKISKKIAGIFL